jgi:DNA-binding IclR family transcriptional regulator
VIRVRESKSAPVGVVGKLLRILEALQSSPAGLQLKDIAQQTGINKSTAFRFLVHLENEGYVFRDDTGAYGIGVKLLQLASGTTLQATLRKIGRPMLDKVWHATAETVNLGMFDGSKVLYIDVIESSHTFRLVSQIGSRRPLHSTALGKAMLAYLPQTEQEHLIASMEFERFTPHTITRPAQLKKDLVLTRERGYALDDEEAYLGSRCVAAPIFDAGGRVVAALSVSGPTTRIPREKIAPFAALVRKAAAEISQRLGHKPQALAIVAAK